MRDKEFFTLKRIFHNCEIKNSCLGSDVSDEAKYEILCVVTVHDEIILRYNSEASGVILKKIDYFAEKKKIIQAISFDPSGAWLLVLCIDNTAHIVPCLSVCDKSASFKPIFSTTEITSYVIPFIGPHECPNAQKCPNLTFDLSQSSDIITMLKRPKRNQFEIKKNRLSASKINELCSSSAYNQIYCDQKPPETLSASSSFHKDPETLTENVPSTSSTPCESQFSNIGNAMFESSTISSGSTNTSCPIPTAILWWQTTHAEQIQNRAIIGYTDGCIVIVRKYSLNSY